MIGFNMTGRQLRQAVLFMMRDEAVILGNHCENFQFSKGFFCEYDCSTHSILQLKMNGEDVRDDDVFLVTTERYYYIQNRFLLLKFVNISYLYEKTGCKIRSNQLY